MQNVDMALFAKKSTLFCQIFWGKIKFDFREIGQ